MALMLAMMLASAGTASALPGQGQGGSRTFLIEQAHFGIATAIVNNYGGGGCPACE
jgi:hypothetical protein